MQPVDILFGTVADAKPTSANCDELEASVWNPQVELHLRLRDCVELRFRDPKRWLRVVTKLVTDLSDLALQWLILDLTQVFKWPHRVASFSNDSIVCLRGELSKLYVGSHPNPRLLRLRGYLGDSDVDKYLEVLKPCDGIDLAGIVLSPRSIHFLQRVLSADEGGYNTTAAAIRLARAGDHIGVPLLRRTLLGNQDVMHLECAVALASVGDELGVAYVLALLEYDVLTSNKNGHLESMFREYPRIVDFSQSNWREQTIRRLRGKLRICNERLDASVFASGINVTKPEDV